MEPVDLNNLTLIDPDPNHFNININFQTYSTREFLESQDTIPNSLNLYHNNSRSLMADSGSKRDQYEAFFNKLDFPFNIIIFTETWLKKDNEGHCNFDGYKSFHLLRPVDHDIDFKTKGGGISIFVKNSIDCKYRKDLERMTPHMECSFIETKFNNQKYLIGGIYRIPDTKICKFINELNGILEPLRSTHKLILLGDYNIDLTKSDTNKTNFELCLQTNYLVPTIFSPTRVVKKIIDGQERLSSTLIDNIFINHNTEHKSGLIETNFSDHYSVFLTIPSITIPSQQGTSTIQYRNINELNIRKFNHLLNSHNIKDVLNNQHAQSAYEHFYNVFDQAYNLSFPIKTKQVTTKDMQKPWINDTLIEKIKIRDSRKKQYIKGRADKAFYTSYHNKLTTELRIAKSNYFHEQFDLHANNIRKTWGVINSAIRSKKVKSIISLTDSEGLEINESHIPNEFIEHYTTNIQDLISNIPSTPKTASSYLKSRVEPNFFLYPIPQNEIYTIIEGLKDNGSKVNSVATSVLLGSRHIISPILAHLLTLFVQQGYFPDNLKLGCITPIFKNGDRDKVNNYRPICTLSPLSKIFEKVINNRMVEFIEHNQIFSDTQFGFRKNMGTEDALMNYTDHIQTQLKNKKFTISIFLDLSKAFDVINHNILEIKLYHYGFRGKFLQFLMSFIKDRRYFVNVNGRNSVIKTVNNGVPQGSTLGPLLFLLYINDMSSCSKLLYLTQFADDSTITYSSKNLNRTLAIIQQEFQLVLKWLLANKLIINLDKTQLMLFTTRSRPEPLTINVDGHNITEIKETKFLGIMLDNNLNWKAHIDYISKKISKTISLLRLLKHSFPSRILKSLYYSLIYPYLNYGNIVWGSAAHTNIEPLKRLQRKCIRIICNTTYTADTEPLFEKLALLKVKQIYDFNCTKFIFCSINKIKYTVYKKRIVTNSSFHNYLTRYRNQLRPEKIQLERFRHSFINNGIMSWNSLPPDIKCIIPLHTFKKKLKKHILHL